MTRAIDAHAHALDTQSARQAAELHVGMCETYLYQAKRANEAPAVLLARAELRRARKKLHKAIEADEKAVQVLRDILEEADERRRKRDAAKARRAAAQMGVVN